MEQTLCGCYWPMKIINLERHADNHNSLWPSVGAGQCTDEILHNAPDPTSFSD